MTVLCDQNAVIAEQNYCPVKRLRLTEGKAEDHIRVSLSALEPEARTTKPSASDVLKITPRDVSAWHQEVPQPVRAWTNPNSPREDLQSDERPGCNPCSPTTAADSSELGAVIRTCLTRLHVHLFQCRRTPALVVPVEDAWPAVAVTASRPIMLRGGICARRARKEGVTRGIRVRHIPPTSSDKLSRTGISVMEWARRQALTRRTRIV
jgi:hypothetical protein